VIYDFAWRIYFKIRVQVTRTYNLLPTTPKMELIISMGYRLLVSGRVVT